ncbi:hypothetical protein KKF73_05060 [Patescibacteria group bacterium]|nr:hypothetical protein [Patescibacteria group bacterium]
MNPEDREELENRRVPLLFHTELVDIIGLETEYPEVLKQIDFIEEFRESEKGIILFNETLLKVGIQYLHEVGLFGAGIYISVLDSGVFLQDKTLVINSMRQSCKDLGYRRNEQGYGLLNIHNLLEVLEE